MAINVESIRSFFKGKARAVILLFLSLIVSIMGYFYAVDSIDPNMNVLHQMSNKSLPNNYTFYTGPRGSIYRFIGYMLAQKAEEHPEILLELRDTAGSFENAIKVATTSRSCGIFQEDTLRRNDAFREDLNYVTPLYLERMHILYRNRDGKSLANGKAINNKDAIVFFNGATIEAGQHGTGTRVFADYLLSYLEGVDTKKNGGESRLENTIRNNDFNGALGALEQGEVDIVFNIVGAPLPGIAEALRRNDKIKLMGIDPIVSQTINKEFDLNLRSATIGRSYDPDLNVPTFASYAYLICSRDVPDSVILELLTILDDNKDKISVPKSDGTYLLDEYDFLQAFKKKYRSYAWNFSRNLFIFIVFVAVTSASTMVFLAWVISAFHVGHAPTSGRLSGDRASSDREGPEEVKHDRASSDREGPEEVKHDRSSSDREGPEEVGHESKRHYHVFLASPGDMDAERQTVRAFFDEFNLSHADRWGVRFDVVDWESWATTGVGRPQGLITRQTLEAHRESLALVVGLMGQRFGSPTGKNESGTEEEFEWALDSRRRTGFPEIKWFFRKIDQLAVPKDPDEALRAVEQWKKVQAFRKRLENDPASQLLYGEFEDGSFADVLRGDLSHWLTDPERPWHSQASDPKERPVPRYPDPETRALSQALKQAYRRRAELEAGGHDTADVTENLLDLRRRIREGGQLREGDHLLDGRYELLESIGRGGFAEVWKAYDDNGRALVAIKVLHGQYVRDATRRDRFFRGARQMARLAHPGVVRVVQPQCEDGGYYFFVMEYLGGGDLQRAVLDGRLSMDERLRIVVEAGAALAFAHEHGMVHRDVKPGNILLDAENRPKLTDFDLVRTGDTTGGTRTMLGTFPYIAPEALVDAKQADVPADVYGLGMTALFAVHGGDLSPEVMWELPEFIASLDVGEDCRAALARAVARKPEQRWASVPELCEALRGTAETTRLERLTMKTTRPSKRPARPPR